MAYDQETILPIGGVPKKKNIYEDGVAQSNLRSIQRDPNSGGVIQSMLPPEDRIPASMTGPRPTENNTRTPEAIASFGLNPQAQTSNQGFGARIGNAAMGEGKAALGLLATAPATLADIGRTGYNLATGSQTNGPTYTEQALNYAGSGANQAMEAATGGTSSGSVLPAIDNFLNVSRPAAGAPKQSASGAITQTPATPSPPQAAVQQPPTNQSAQVATSTAPQGMDQGYGFGAPIVGTGGQNGPMQNTSGALNQSLLAAQAVQTKNTNGFTSLARPGDSLGGSHFSGNEVDSINAGIRARGGDNSFSGVGKPQEYDPAVDIARARVAASDQQSAQALKDISNINQKYAEDFQGAPRQSVQRQQLELQRQQQVNAGAPNALNTAGQGLDLQAKINQAKNASQIQSMQAQLQKETDPAKRALLIDNLQAAAGKNPNEGKFIQYDINTNQKDPITGADVWKKGLYDVQKSSPVVLPEQKTYEIPNKKAIAYLNENLHTAPLFDAQYGSGAAERYRDKSK